MKLMLLMPCRSVKSLEYQRIMLSFSSTQKDETKIKIPSRQMLRIEHSKKRGQNFLVLFFGLLGKMLSTVEYPGYYTYRTSLRGILVTHRCVFSAECCYVTRNTGFFPKQINRAVFKMDMDCVLCEVKTGLICMCFQNTGVSFQVIMSGLYY